MMSHFPVYVSQCVCVCVCVANHKLSSYSLRDIVSFKLPLALPAHSKWKRVASHLLPFPVRGVREGRCLNA